MAGGLRAGSGRAGMLSHTEQLNRTLPRVTLASPPPRQPNPVEPIAGCRGQEGPLGGGGGWGGRGVPWLRSGFLALTIPQKGARKQRAAPLYLTSREESVVLPMRAPLQLVRTWGRRKEMKLHNERLRMFLEQRSFFLVTRTSRSYLSKAAVLV